MNVLFTSPMLPYPPFREGRDNLRTNYGNCTYGQDIFAVPTHMHFYGIHLIAQNIGPPSTVLECPSEAVFVRELRKQPDIVGISFVLPFFSRVVEMCKLVRKHAPRAKVVLGGHGVQCFAHATGREDELRSLADEICHGEGVRFFRELLGEDTERRIVQDLPPGAVIPFRNPLLRQPSATLVSALGCSNACDFCAPSAFFGHRRIPLASPRELYEAVKLSLGKYPISGARILDDNFLVDKDYVREFGLLLKNDAEVRRRRFTYGTFADMHAISQYTPEELVEYGLSGVLIGVESTYVSKLRPSVNRKMTGIDARALFRSLTDHGILIEGSMILGWDFHDDETIRKDIDAYVSLGATFDQIVCLMPVPETRLSRQLQKEGRLYDDLSWDDLGFYARWHKYEHFTHDELWAHQDWAEQKAYETWGPSYLRLFEVRLKGYRKLKGHPEAFFRERAESYADDCRQLFALLPAIRVFAPNDHVRHEVDRLRNEYVAALGPPRVEERLMGVAGLAQAAVTKLRRRLFREDTVQPKTEVFHYPGVGVDRVRPRRGHAHLPLVSGDSP
jgi:radical SAM superfamily enzyme YgiQ (UPF0313 family)